MKNKMKLPFVMEIGILEAWGIWIIRNNKIFNNQPPSLASWKVLFLRGAKLLSCKMKNKHADSFKEWLQSQT
jgi:hypothetical protein